jgi:hypothetical protein
MEATEAGTEVEVPLQATCRSPLGRMGYQNKASLQVKVITNNDPFEEEITIYHYVLVASRRAHRTVTKRLRLNHVPTENWSGRYAVIIVQ